MALGKAINTVKYEVLVLLALLGYATNYYIEVYQLSSKQINLLLVQPVYWILCVCTVALIGFKIKEASTSDKSPEHGAESSADDLPVATAKRREFYRQAAGFAVLTVLYVLALDRLGFVSASFLYVATLTFWLGARSFWLVLVLPAAVVGFLYVSMAILLRFSLPAGLIF